MSQHTAALPQSAFPPGLKRARGMRAMVNYRMAGIAAVLVGAAIYAAHRILTFVPQPLDSPGTLRPALYSWYLRFVMHYGGTEAAHLAWREWCYLLLALPPALALGNYLLSGENPGIKLLTRVAGSKLFFFGAIAAMLLMLRFPILLAADLNPDETQFLAAAETLFHDPNFFRSVDLGTSGPLNVFPLMLPAVFGISPDYVSGRLIGIAILLATVFVIYRVFTMLLPESWARIAILPLAGSFAVMKQPDFVHYSSEHVAFLLTALAILAAVKTIRDPERYAANLAWLGCLLSAASLAKWQALPGIACVMTIALAWVWWEEAAVPAWRPALMAIYGMAPLTLLNLAVCAATGVLQEFWMAYVAGNLGYVAQGAPTSAAQFLRFVLDQPENHWMLVTLVTVFAAHAVQMLCGRWSSGAVLFLRMAATCGIAAATAETMLIGSSQATSVYQGLLALAALCAGVLVLFQKEDGEAGVPRWFGFLTGASLLTAIAAVYTPRRPFAHYQLFLLVPLALATAWPLVYHATAAKWNREPQEPSSGGAPAAKPLLIVFTLVVLAGQITMASIPDRIPFSQPRTIRSPQGEYIDALVPAGGQITVWGYDARPYVDSARTTPTRDTNMADLFRKQEPIDTFYRQRFLRDLQRHPAALFLDARETSLLPIPGFETVPAIDSFIQSNYVYLNSGFGKRFYIRKDLVRGQR